VYTLYAHLSEFKVNHGASVREGDVIALSGNTCESSGPHLHLSVIMTINFDDWNKFESSVDPQWFIGIQ
jgi:murein DD-endopeptidase MepM/ murein hydrolase activator NlpD